MFLLQLQLLMQETVSLVTKPNFTTILCYAFEGQEQKVRMWYACIKICCNKFTVQIQWFVYV